MNGMNGKSLLLVEDNKNVQDFNTKLLEGRGYAVSNALTLAEARESVTRQMPDAIVLDIGMPDGSGLDFLRELRRESNVPVLLLTGYTEDDDVIRGFESGCNDYLQKPYTFGVLLVRLQRMMQSAEQMPEIVSRGLLTLKLASRKAYVDGVNLLLTPTDFALLHYFTQNENTLMSAERIYETIWGQPLNKNTQALNSAVTRLRKKLTGCGYTITAEYRTGYRFEREPSK
jgi:DNA-binding response OmpR family regulator